MDSETQNEPHNEHDYSDQYYLGENNKNKHREVPLSEKPFHRVADSINGPEEARRKSKLLMDELREKGHGNYDRNTQLIRILEIDPIFGLRLAELVNKPDEFDQLFNLTLGTLSESKKIGYFKETDDPFKKIQELIGDYKIIDTVRVEASGVTEVMQIQNKKGKNFRIWRHFHDSQSGGEDSGGVETILYEEDPRKSAYELGSWE